MLRGGFAGLAVLDLVAASVGVLAVSVVELAAAGAAIVFEGGGELAEVVVAGVVTVLELPASGEVVTVDLAGVEIAAVERLPLPLVTMTPTTTPPITSTAPTTARPSRDRGPVAAVAGEPAALPSVLGGGGAGVAWRDSGDATRVVASACPVSVRYAGHA